MKKGVKTTDADKEMFLEALKNCAGFIVTAADATGISRQTHYNWMNSDPEYAEQVALILERNLDMAESKLLKNIENGSETSLFYYLNNKGKSRGYNVKDANEDDNRKIEITINSPLGGDSKK